MNEINNNLDPTENKDDDLQVTPAEVIEDENPIDSDNADKTIDTTDESMSFKQTYEQASSAIAISYDEEEGSPFIKALGNESKATAIIEMAKELGIYVHKDPMLFNELKNLKEGEKIPSELFEIIAAILSFSYILQGKTPESYTRQDGTKAINTNA